MLAKLLPQKEAEILLSVQPVDSNEVDAFFTAKNKWIQDIHYSWFREPLEKAPASFQKVILTALPVNVATALDTSAKRIGQYPETVRQLVLEVFFRYFSSCEPGADVVLPKALLPKSDLGPLLTLSKQELVDIITLLAMFDLADEIRHVVDRKLLQMIVGRLPQKMQRFLRSCMSQKAKLALAPMHIEKIYKDERQFDKKLHHRGLQRLAIALSGQSVDFIWHFLHTLDTGRGNVLMKQINREVQPSTPVAKMQLLVAVQYIKDMRKDP